MSETDLEISYYFDDAPFNREYSNELSNQKWLSRPKRDRLDFFEQSDD